MKKNNSLAFRNNKFGISFFYFFLFFLFTIFRTNAQNCTVNAGIPRTICANSPLVLLGGSGGGNDLISIVWTQVAGPSVVIQNPNSAVTTVLGAVGGNSYRFRLTGTCTLGTTFQEVTITVSPITIANAGVAVQGCPGTYTLTANSPLNAGETGLWSISGANNAGVTINSPNSPSSTITTSANAAGTSSLVWTISSANCSSSSTVNITNYGGEVVANAGVDQTLSECYTVTQSTNLNASIGGNGTGSQIGTWSLVSGPSVPSIANVNSANSSVTGLRAGTYVFRWSVQGPCALGSDTVTIRVPPATQDVTTASGINNSQTFCDNSVTSTILQGNTPLYAGETVEWTTTSSATIVSPNSPTTQITGLNFNTTASYSFTYKIKGNSAVNPNCSSQSTFTVNYFINPTAVVLNGGVTTYALPVNIGSGSVTMSTTGGNADEATFINGPSGVSPSFSFSSGNFNFSNLSKPGTYTFRVRRYTNGSFATGCSDSFADINVIVSRSPEVSNAGTSVALLCGVTQTQLSGNNPALMTTPGLTGYWSQVSGPNTAVFDDITYYNPIVNGLISGVYVFRWNIYGGVNAVDTFSETSITVSQPPTSNAGATPVTVCSGSYKLDALPLINGQTGLWTQIDANPAVTIVNANDPKTYVTGMLVGSTYTLRWTVTSAAVNCTPASSDVVINTTSTFSPSPAIAGSDQCLASGTTTTNLAATALSSGSGLWTKESGPSATITDPTFPNSQITGLTDGIYVFKWTTSSDPTCVDFTDTVVITVASSPIASAGPDQNVCTNGLGNSVTMNANTPSTSLVGKWVQVSGNSSWTVSDINSPQAVFSNLAQGNYVFRWVVSRGNCDSASDEISFSVSYPPTAANVTSNTLTVCGTSAILNGNIISEGVGTWQVVSGPNVPSFSNINSPTSGLSGLVTGTYFLKWTSINGAACSRSESNLTITVNAPANAGPDQTLCNATEIILQGTEGSIGTWSETTSNGATVTPISSSTARATITPGTNYTFQYDISSLNSGGCGATSDSMTVTNSALPTTPAAGSDQDVCLSLGNSITMAGNSITSGTGTWSKVTGPSGGNITSVTSNTTTVTGLTEGIYIFKWTASNGSCSNLSDVVRINAYAAPSTANAGPDQNECQLATQLNATAPTTGIGTWALTTDPSSGGVIIDSPNNPKSTLTIANPYLLPIGVYVFTWTVRNGPVCTPSVDTVSITFTGVPPTPANAGPDQSLCNATTVVMNANPVNPGVGTWSQVSGPNTGIFSNRFSASSSISGLVNGVYVFKWTSSNGGGCSLEDTVTVTINPAVAIVNAGPDQTLGEYSTLTMAATNPAPNTGTWTLVSGPNTPVILDVNSPTTQIAGGVPGTYVFKYSVSNGSCTIDSDTVVITLIGQTDLSLEKSASVNTPVVGDIVTFTVAVRNNGNRDATGVGVIDNLPIGYSLITGTVSNSGVFNSGGNAINWSGLSIANGATLNLTYNARVNVITGAANEFRNTAQVTASNQIDPNSTPNNNVASENDQSSVTLTPIPRINLSLTKSVNNSTPMVGSNVAFTISLSNAGPSNATGVIVKDLLPNGFTFVSATATTGSYVNGTGDWTVGTINSGSTQSLVVNATVNLTGNYTNVAEVTAATQSDSNSTPNNNVLSEDDQDDVTVVPVEKSDLSLTKTISGGPYRVGDNVTFTVTVSNAGPSAATSVNVADYLPTGYTYVSHTSAGTTYNTATGAWNVGTINSGASRVLSIIAKINDSGDYRNMAEVVFSNQFDPDSTPGNNNLAEDDQQQVVISPVQIADLSLVKTVDVASPRAGDTVKFTLALTNSGPSAATAVIVNDLLPVGYTFLSYTATSGNYNATNGNWVLSGNVLNGKTEYLDIFVRVKAASGASNEYRNNAQVTASNQTDPDSVPNDGTGDDFSTITLTPSALVDLALTKTVNNSTPAVGSNVVFTVLLSNSGPSIATGVVVKDLLPNGFTFVSANATAGSYVNGTGNWSVGSINSGSTQSLVINATVNPTGTYTNVAEVTAANESDSDSAPNNNILSEDDQDDVTLIPVEKSDLSLTKTISAGPYLVGSNVTFTITVSNAGPSAATAVNVTDFLPSGYTYISHTSTGTTYTLATGSWDVGTINSGASKVLSVVARINATGDYRNVAEVVFSNQSDPDSTPGNNNLTEDDQQQVAITPVEIADLSLIKTVDFTSPRAGDTVKFTIALTNSGPSAATSVTVKDLLPVGFTFLNYASTSGNYDATSGNWTPSGSVLSGKTEYLDVFAKVNAFTGATDEYKNTAQVTASNQTDPDSTPNDGAGDDYSTITLTPNALIDLSLRKSVNNVAPPVGTTVVFTVTVSNAGPSDATGVIVKDLLPSGYTFVSATPSSGSYVNGTGLWTIGSIFTGSNQSLIISATVNPTGNYTNVAEVTQANETDIDSTPNNNTLSEDDQDAVTTSRSPLIDLSVNKTVDNSTPAVGNTVIFTVTVANAGPSSATAIVVTDKLPTGFSFSSATTAAGSYNNLTGSWTVGTLTSGASATLTVRAIVLPTGNYHNIAEVTGANEVDSNSTPGNNDPIENDQHDVTVFPVQKADLSVVKTINVPSTDVGNNVVFTIQVANSGPSDATGVTISDLLPSGYEFVSASPTTGLYNHITGEWAITKAVAASSTETLLITAKVLKNGSYLNAAQVATSNQIDPDSTPNDGAGDDFSFVNFSPISLVDLVMTKRVNNATPDVGSLVDFTLEVVNNGPSNATQVSANDLLPSGYTWISDTGSASYNKLTGLWNIGNLAQNARISITITAMVNPTGTYTNTASVSSFENEKTPADNTNSVTTTPRPIADLSLIKTIANASPNVGTNAVFSITVTNSGPSAATNVVVTDLLPSGYSFVSAAPPVAATYNVATGSWTVGTLSSGASATMTLTAKVLGSGNYNNIAEVTGSDQYDPNSIPRNNNNFENDQSEVVVTPVNEANLVTVKTAASVLVRGISSSNPNEEDTIKYRIIVTNNNGPTDATGVQLTDIVPFGLTYISHTASPGTIYNQVTGNWSIGNLAVNNSVELEVTVKVNVGTKGTTITNRTTAAVGNQLDPTIVGDDLIESVEISMPPDAVNYTIRGNRTNLPSSAINLSVNNRLRDGVILPTSINSIIDLNPNTPGIEISLNVPGEGVWNYNPLTGEIVFTPSPGFTADPTPLVYKLIEIATGLSDIATVTVDYDIVAPVAINDLSIGNPINSIVTVNPLATNGSGPDADPDGVVVATTISLIKPSGATTVVIDSNGEITSFDVPNEGKWSVDPTTGAISFIPLSTFHLDPTPVLYTVKDNDGNVSNTALVTIDYVPVAQNDKNSIAGVVGTSITINVAANDTTGDLVDVTSITLDATSILGGIQISPKEVAVSGVGRYIADVNGNVTFIPEIGFQLDPPIIRYTIRDNENNISNLATITFDYAPVTSADLSVGNPINVPVVVTVTANDITGDLIALTTVSLVNPGNATNSTFDASGDLTSFSIPGEGTWNVDLVNGKVIFTPNPGFITDPTPISYTVKDDEGNRSNASLITIRMIPQADLIVTKTDNKEKYIPGTNNVYTITVKNNGPASATNVVVLDDITDPILQAAATWRAVATGNVALSNATGTGDLTSSNATIATMAVGEQVTYTVTIAVPSDFTGAIVNAASASSTNVADPNPSNNAQTDTDTLNGLSSLVVTKSIVTAAPYKSGDVIEFLISARNNGPSDATGISIVDKLPSGYAFITATASNGVYNEANGLWNLGNLSNASSATLTVFARINASGNYTNVAEITKVDQLDPNGIIHGNHTPGEIDQSDVTISPVGVTDLITTKTVDNPTPNFGDIVQYTISVVNKGPSLATNVILQDNLPAGTSYVSHIATGGTVNTYSGGQWTIGNLNNQSSAILVINAKVTAVGTITQSPIINTTTAAVADQLDPTTVGDDLTEPIIVTCANLITEKTVSNPNPSEGETITYSIKVTNNGPSDATGVSLVDILPLGIAYVSNNQGADYNYGSGIWTVGNLANGATKTLNIDVTINSGSAGKTIINKTTAAKGNQSDPSSLGDDLIETINVKNGADIILTKVVNNATPNVGDIVTYTVTVTNKSTTLVTNLVVKDQLSVGLQLVAATPGIGVWNTPNWTIGTLQPGEKGSIEIKALVAADQGGNVLINTVSNTQDQFDTNATVDDATESITVTSLDLAVTKTVNNTRPNEADVITYTIKVVNNGASNATNVSLIDKLPVGVTYVDDQVSAGVYNNGSGLWTIGNLANGESATLTLQAKVNFGTYDTTITNTTSAVKADQSDSNLSNNRGSVSIFPTANIDLSLTKAIVGNITNPSVGDVITFEVRVLNGGPTKATGVEVVDLIPSGYKFVTYSSTIGTYDPITGLWKVGFVEVGNPAILLVDAKVLASGNYNNCAEITKANEPDIDSTPGNSIATEDDYACASAPPNQTVDLAIVKTILTNNTSPKVNSEISFEIQLTNNGTIDATNIIVSDLLPSGYTFTNYSSTKGVYDYLTGDWKINKILNGETEILIIDVIVKESGDYLNCATIKSLQQTDSNASNNKSCIGTTPIAVVDLELTKTVDNLKPKAESEVEFTITLTNRGPSKATGVEVKDVLPNGFKFISALSTLGTYEATTGIWKVGNIGINGVQTLKIKAFVNPVGVFTNSAEVVAANELDTDSTPKNNIPQEDDQASVTLEPEVALVLAEGFTPNGDGINDVFEIEHLQVLYPNFSMEIVNRYGNIVYQYKHNGDKFSTPLWWDGYSTGRWNFSKELLPAGTYFYTIYFNNNERKPQTGWVYLKK
ncbi:PKD domain-containing protein [Flavobacterium sp. TSSA_36]|uniref:PKD domain-containing protein n=1 Tax=Flavobacterium sp. TSSA_36 TaxID=3447669 RepID=UPI003F34B640